MLIASLAGCGIKPSPEDRYFRNYVDSKWLDEQPTCDGRAFDGLAALPEWQSRITDYLLAHDYAAQDIVEHDFANPELLGYRKIDSRWHVMYGFTSPSQELPNGSVRVVHGGTYVTLDACTGDIRHHGEYRTD